MGRLNNRLTRQYNAACYDEKQYNIAIFYILKITKELNEQLCGTVTANPEHYKFPKVRIYYRALVIKPYNPYIGPNSWFLIVFWSLCTAGLFISHSGRRCQVKC